MSNNHTDAVLTRASFAARAGKGALVVLAGIGLLASSVAFAAHSAGEKVGSATAASTGVETFDTPERAASAIVDAARSWNTAKLRAMLGPDGDDIIFSGDYASDRRRSADFAAEAAKKTRVAVDPKSGKRATLFVGENDWPFPVPIVKRGGRWVFDAAAGRREIKYRRIGENELDAIEVCRGYVEAQLDYARRPRVPYEVSQYAQKIISTSGKQDGLAWQNPDGSWGGPIGENIAKAIEQGYTPDAEPYHGYFFKILTGQGPAATLGQMDYVIEGVMIGGFALVASPAVYGVTGLMTFIVSYDGVVYEKDLGTKTSQSFEKMERFNPDKSWRIVPDHE
jgi:hypothetical protein